MALRKDLAGTAKDRWPRIRRGRGQQSGLWAKPETRAFNVAKLALPALVLTLGCAAVGHHVSLLTDDIRATERAQSLAAVAHELRPALSPASRDGATVAADVTGSIPIPAAGAQAQPLVEKLFWSLVALSFGGLAIFAVFAIRKLQRVQRAFAQSNDRLHRLTREDALTGLPHHRAVLDALDRAIVSRKPREVVAFAFFDLDGFKEINDLEGREIGDQVLAAVAERLKSVLPQSAVGGRFGGDEFALVVAAEDFDAAVAAVEKVSAALARPHWVAGKAAHLTVTGGFALSPRDGVSRDDITRRADLALRRAKRDRRGETLGFSPAIDIEFQDRRGIEQELRRALARDELELHYQPIVAADGSGMVGVEALLRWQHPQRGPISPLEFVPVAEQSGLMAELGQFVLRRALTDAKRWPDLFIAVNLSPVQVRDPALVDVVSCLLAESGVAPERLELEITEGVLIDNPEEARQRLDALRALGIRLALDDFGTGYSSLSYLQRLSFDKLKIDQSFVAPLGQSPNAGAMIQAIVALGRALGLSVLVEGVETEAQRVLLRLAGCDQMQGYRFARPGPPDTIDQMQAGLRAQAGMLRRLAVAELAGTASA